MIEPRQLNAFRNECEKLAVNVPLPVLLAGAAGLAGGVGTWSSQADHRHQDQLLADLGEMTPEVKAMRDKRRLKAIAAGAGLGAAAGAASPYAARYGISKGRVMADELGTAARQRARQAASDLGRMADEKVRSWARGATDEAVRGARAAADDIGYRAGQGATRAAAEGMDQHLGRWATEAGGKATEEAVKNMKSSAEDLGRRAARGAVEGGSEGAAGVLKPGIWRRLFLR